MQLRVRLTSELPVTLAIEVCADLAGIQHRGDIVFAAGFEQ